MVCPYCSTDMEPIELNGKVFCSNCGLTVAAAPTPALAKLNPEPETTTVEPETAPSEEVEFPATIEAPAPEIESSTPAENDQFANLTIDKLATDVQEKSEPIAVKLEVKTEEEQKPSPVPLNPITEEAKKDLGMTPEEPVFESKIGDIEIPSEEDFSNPTAEEETAGSYVELANPGDEKETLEASGILLDILEEGQPKQEVEGDDVPAPAAKLPQAEETENNLSDLPELPSETETDEEDDIYTLPNEVKVGLTNRKVVKKAAKAEKQDKDEVDDEIAEKDSQPEPAKDETPEPETAPSDTKIEKKIAKLEQKIAEAPEPIVDLAPEEAEKYDPDTINVHDDSPDDYKSKLIKEYFSNAIEQDKKPSKEKSKKKKKKHKSAWEVVVSFFAFFGGVVLLAIVVYLVYIYLQPTGIVQQLLDKVTG